MTRSYNVEITEAYARVVTVEAGDEYEALRIAEAKYKNCEIVLDSADFVDYDIGILEGR